MVGDPDGRVVDIHHLGVSRWLHPHEETESEIVTVFVLELLIN